MTIKQTDFRLPISQDDRYIVGRFSCDDSFQAKKTKQPLVIMCSGYDSYMDKPSQKRLNQFYMQQGFATLQFNFLGHGSGETKSDGSKDNTTISSGLKDLSCMWKYTQNTLNPIIDADHVCISGNSYGALVSLIAAERGLIHPESMALVAPFSFDRFRSQIIPLCLLNKIYHRAAAKILRLPVSDAMIQDLRQHYLKSVLKMDKLGSTAVHFFIGREDRVASVPTVYRWHHQINQAQNDYTPFIDNKQSHLKVYPHCGHGNFTPEVEQDIHKNSARLFRQTRMLRYILENDGK